MPILIKTHQSATNAYFRLDFDETKVKIWKKNGTMTRTNSTDSIQDGHNYSYNDLFENGAERTLYVQALEPGEHDIDVTYVLDGVGLWTEKAWIATVWIEFADYLTNIRNLTHPDDDYAQYTNCIAIEWQASPNNKINLYNLLDITPVYYSSDKITFEIADSIFGSATVDANDYLIYTGSDPGEGNIYSFGINSKFDGIVTDKLIVVVYSPDTYVIFTNWYANSADMTWLNELPPVYSRLGANNTDPEPNGSNTWYAPGSPHLYYHNDAEFSMRSSVTAGGHGHQACYDVNGNLIESGVAAGSADFSAPWSFNNWSLAHVNNDVKPFVWAFQLDGNPVERTNLGYNTSNPLMIEGAYIEKYFERRPPHTNNQINPE
jgi:hypothetical protein